MTIMDKDAVRTAAKGRMEDILADVAGISRRYLTDREGPCPWCSDSRPDSTRFRVIDKDAGAVFCSHCFNSGNGDVFSAVMKGCHVAFPEAIRRVAEYIGYQSNGNSETSKAKRLKPPERSPEDLAGEMIRGWCEHKMGVRPDAVEAAGGYPARYRNREVIVFPAISGDGSETVGCDCYCQNGEPWPKTEYLRDRKSHNISGSVDGLVIVGGHERLNAACTIIKCEGIPDALALHSVLPEHFCAVTNICGAKSKKGARQLAAAIEGTSKHLVIIHDSDGPGQEGAEIVAKHTAAAAESVKNVVLPYTIEPDHGKDLRDFIVEGHTWLDIAQMIESTEVVESEELPTKCIVHVDLDEAEVAEQVVDALGSLAWSDDTKISSRVYQRFGQLVHIVETADAMVCGVELPKTMLRIRALPAPIIRERIASAATLVGPPRKNCEPVPIRPPGWLVNAIHQRGQYLPIIRSLAGIVRCPTLRPGGTVIQKPGYDNATGLVYAPDGEYPTIENRPSKDSAVHAARELWKVVCDFPFAGDEHRSCWLAHVLTGVGRFAIAGPTPMVTYDANTRGSGKGLLCDAASIIAYGHRLPRKTWSNDDSEIRKTITAVALENLPAVLLDNVTGTLGCASLDAALTATSWQDRLLGKNETTGVLPLTTIWIATGNNIVIGADTARRILYCRIESQHENPEERMDFQYPDLLAWITKQRHRLAVAAVTVLRAYVANGRPDQDLPVWGSYEAWSQLIRNAIVWIGFPDPAQTRAIVRRSDRSSELLRLILDGIEEADRGEGITSVEIQRLISHPVGPNEKDTIPMLRGAIGELCGSKIDSRRIGYGLRSYIERVYGGRRLVKNMTRKGVARWSVEKISAGDAGDAGHVPLSLAGEADNTIPSFSNECEIPNEPKASPACPASPAPHDDEVRI